MIRDTRIEREPLRIAWPQKTKKPNENLLEKTKANTIAELKKVEEGKDKPAEGKTDSADKTNKK